MADLEGHAIDCGIVREREGVERLNGGFRRIGKVLCDHHARHYARDVRVNFGALEWTDGAHLAFIVYDGQTQQWPRDGGTGGRCLGLGFASRYHGFVSRCGLD